MGIRTMRGGATQDTAAAAAALTKHWGSAEHQVQVAWQ